MCSKRKLDNKFMYMLVETCPKISDPRELETILKSSLKFLFGECEPHGCLVEVEKAKPPFCIVKCPAASVSHIRAALTCPTPPPYLQSTLYRFDVLQIAADKNALET